MLKEQKRTAPKQDAATALAGHLPRRLAQDIVAVNSGGRLADLPDSTLVRLGKAVNNWQVFPAGTEGYRTAEVTLGGVDTNDLSSKTMRAKTVPGLFFMARWLTSQAIWLAIIFNGPGRSVLLLVIVCKHFLS